MIGRGSLLWAAPLLVALLLPGVALASGSFEAPAPTVSIDPNAFVPDQGGGDVLEPHDHERAEGTRIANAAAPDPAGGPPRLLPPIDHFLRRDAARRAGEGPSVGERTLSLRRAPEGSARRGSLR